MNKRPETEFAGLHDGCYLDLPHRHCLKRVENGYVLGEVVQTEEVIHALLALLRSDEAEKRRFAASNLMHSEPGMTLEALRSALDSEKDSFTAGIIIAALGTLGRMSAVESINKWKSRAGEAFIAHNILESYLGIWLKADCGSRRSEISCGTIYETVREFSECDDAAVSRSAARIMEILELN